MCINCYYRDYLQINAAAAALNCVFLKQILHTQESMQWWEGDHDTLNVKWLTEGITRGKPTIINWANKRWQATLIIYLLLPYWLGREHNNAGKGTICASCCSFVRRHSGIHSLIHPGSENLTKILRGECFCLNRMSMNALHLPHTRPAYDVDRMSSLFSVRESRDLHIWCRNNGRNLYNLRTKAASCQLNQREVVEKSA